MQYIDIESAEYPYLLRQITDPPAKLYFKGNWDPGIFNETLSVVGSRKMTAYGEKITPRLLMPLAAENITIVSGFMYGIDACAHEAALDGGGKTVAVMPCGVDRIHPEYQSDLHERILQSGLVISEYPAAMPPALWTYPRRNRIIAGLSPVLLVVEAGLKSGALITAKIAQKYNKRIFAVPGPLTSRVSLGTALLIKHGAFIVTSEDDLLFEYGKDPSKKLRIGQKPEGLNRLQQKIIELLSLQPLRIDELTRLTKAHPSDTAANLTILSLKRIITSKDGRFYLSEGEENAY